MTNTPPGALIRNEAPPELELDRFLRGPSLRGVTSRGLPWPDYLVEEQIADTSEREESVASYVFLLMWRARTSGELKVEGRGFMPYTKCPGQFTFFPAGPVPAVRPFTRSEFLVFAVRSSFIETLELEMDRRPTEEMRTRTGFQDSGLNELMSLLSAEAARGGIFGRIYADSLAQAIAARLLYFNQADCRPARCVTSPLPRHLLRRVIERMQDLDTDLDLRTLAAETGYSQRHFIRMFRAATGQTPHRFLVELRLDHAKKLLRQHRASLIDVAAASGFSSHAHMTQVFRRVLGVTPSEFRKGTAAN
jgi:AraC family transcriptional regulator